MFTSWTVLGNFWNAEPSEGFEIKGIQFKSCAPLIYAIPEVALDFIISLIILDIVEGGIYSTLTLQFVDNSQ